MTTQLNTVEAIEQAIQAGEDNGRSTLVYFPSGRTFYVNLSMGLANRIKGWLNQYRVEYDRNRVLLSYRTFDYTPQQNAMEIRREIRQYSEYISAYELTRNTLQTRLDSMNTNIPKGPTPETIQELTTRWPELLAAEASSGAGWRINLTFVPVVFVDSAGKIAFSTSLRLVVKRDGTWSGLVGAGNIHPHTHRSGVAICQGNTQELFKVTTESNQVISSLDIIRRWRLGYDVRGIYDEGWERRGWAWLQQVRMGQLRVEHWGGVMVQHSLTGEVLPINDLLEGKVDAYIHIGLDTGWVNWSRVEQIGTELSVCAGCDGPARTCGCHGHFCVGCLREDCICSGSKYLLDINDSYITTVIPIGRYAGSCAECRGIGPNVVRRMPTTSSGFGLMYCRNCSEYGGRAVAIREAIEREAQ